ncbi:hypothetical protein ACLOJK_019549 [Asimina triloba]
MWGRISLLLPSEDDSNRGEPESEIGVQRCEGYNHRSINDKLLPPCLLTSTEERLRKSAPPHFSRVTEERSSAGYCMEKLLED